MANPLWIPATLAAATFQVGRNALQRGVMPSSGPWGATLVRFLFGLPFSIVFVLFALLVVPDADPHWSSAFWISAIVGAASQILATAALLSAMHRSGFAVGTALQQSSLPMTALFGLIVYGDHIGAIAWLGVAITTIGLAALSWPSPRQLRASTAGAAFGLASGAMFGFSLNAFRHAALALDGEHPIFAAILCVAVVQAMQTVALILFLAWRDAAALAEVLRRWRPSLGAGLCGACASVGWFVALALSPAAPVRALGIIEAPIAAIAGHRFFREALSLRQMVAGAAVIGGVLLITLF
ncbi:DMT family transporter [Sphingomonas sp. HT-1]|uniref:DMT family transporter n=1 Tax=unclassified Sphingomonas TaxID=196159 RepID=UPI0002D2A317|nr:MULTISPECIES: DMT family transporter [unclassified Sphingomonas]KTF68601.1 multidrug transporter [Sphingomonas sp. WG]